MIEPKMIELMNLAVDGNASPSERAKLDHYLESSAEARSYYEALKRLVLQLDADPIPDPPGALERRILGAIENLPATMPMRAQEQSPSWLRSFFAPRLRPWSTFALGLAAGLLILVIAQQDRLALWTGSHDIDPSNLSGSMVSESPAARVEVGSIAVDSPSDAATGSAVVYRQGAGTVVDITLHSDTTIGWTLTYDANAWTLDRIERRGSATEAFAANHGAIQGINTGEGGLALVFSGSPEAAQAIVLKVVQDGQTVFEGSPSMIH